MRIGQNLMGVHLLLVQLWLGQLLARIRPTAVEVLAARKVRSPGRSSVGGVVVGGVVGAGAGDGAGDPPPGFSAATPRGRRAQPQPRFRSRAPAARAAARSALQRG